MLKTVDLIYQTMLAEIGQRAMDDAWTLDFPPIGRFVKVKVKEREYWYFDQSDGEGGQKRKYVGLLRIRRFRNVSKTSPVRNPTTGYVGVWFRV